MQPRAQIEKKKKKNDITGKETRGSEEDHYYAGAKQGDGEEDIREWKVGRSQSSFAWAQLGFWGTGWRPPKQQATIKKNNDYHKMPGLFQRCWQTPATQEECRDDACSPYPEPACLRIGLGQSEIFSDQVQYTLDGETPASITYKKALFTRLENDTVYNLLHTRQGRTKSQRTKIGSWQLWAILWFFKSGIIFLRGTVDGIGG